MSQAVLDDLSLQIIVGEETLEVQIARDQSSSVFSAKVQILTSSSLTLARLLEGEAAVKGECIHLKAQDFLAADAELRKILLSHKLKITTTYYWYTLGDPKNEDILCLEDNDPQTHTSIRIGNYTCSFFPDRAARDIFSRRLQQSNLCKHVHWQDYDTVITLFPAAADRRNRLETFKTLVGLFQPQDEK